MVLTCHQAGRSLSEAAAKAKEGGVSAPLCFGWQSWTQIENYSAWHNIEVGSRENGFTGLDTAFTFNNDHVVNHIQRIADMGSEGYLFEYGGRRGDSRANVNGESVFWINSSAYYGGFKKDIKNFEFGQTMLPLDTDVASAPQRSIIGGATLRVLNGHDSDAYKGVAKFFKFLSAPEQQAYWHQTTGYVPITTAAYELSRSQGFYESNPGTDTAIKLAVSERTDPGLKLGFASGISCRSAMSSMKSLKPSGLARRRQGRRWTRPSSVAMHCSQVRESQPLTMDCEPPCGAARAFKRCAPHKSSSRTGGCPMRFSRRSCW